MNPFERLEAQYVAHPRAEPFAHYVDWYLRHGFVFSRPDLFVCGRPVIAAADAEDILDDRHLFASEDCDCWYLMAASGNMARMWSVVPWPLPWFCWVRLTDPLNEIAFASAERLKRLCPPDLSTMTPYIQAPTFAGELDGH